MLCRTCILTTAVLMLGQTGPLGEDTPAARAAAHVDQATSVLVSAPPPSDSGQIALAALVDALVDAVPPSSDVGAACGANMAVVSWKLVHRAASLASAVPEFDRCYRETHGGAAFHPPDGVRTPAEGRAFVQRQLDLARRLILQDPANAVRPLIETIMFIVTPIEA